MTADLPLGALAAFFAAAETGKLSGAAARLGLSQPAITQRIHGLERVIGQPLFTRTPAGVDLTPAGLTFREELRPSWELWQRTAQPREGGPPAGAVRAAYTLSTERQVAGLLRQLAVSGHSLVTRRLWTSEMSRAVAAGQLDIGFARHPEFWGDLRCELLWENPLVLTVPAGHPLAARPVVSLAELAGEPLAVVPRSLSPGSYDIVHAALLRAGVAPRLVPQAHVVGRAGVSPDTRQLAGLGPALMPDEYAAGTVRVRLAERVNMGLHMISRHSDADYPPVRAVLAVMRAAAAGTAAAGS